MIHRVPMCALRFARNSLSGWKLASREYFSFFFPKFFREGRYPPQAISSNADQSFGTANSWQNRSHMGVREKRQPPSGAKGVEVTRSRNPLNCEKPVVNKAPIHVAKTVNLCGDASEQPKTILNLF
jgi:hypothetical protein